MREVISQMKKSTIAKLLAEEDISVVHKKTKTASFDVKKRELVLPIFKDKITNDLYDMFVCHEVGHSLWTPLDMLERTHKEGIDKSVVNVIEDARIEAMIQKRYPGSVKNFQNGYKELLDKNFFGIKNKDLSRLNVIDKINIYFKTGLDVKFNTQEKKLADKVAKCKTPEDVLKLAVEIAGYHQKKKQEDKDKELKISINAPKKQDDEGESGSDSSSDTNEDTEELSMQEQESEYKDDGGEELDKDKDDKQEQGDGNSGAGLGKQRIKKSDLVATTEYGYQSAMDSHNDQEARDRAYVNIPKAKLKDLIIGYKEILSDQKKHYSGEYSHITDYINDEYTKLVNDNKKIVSYMVKEFEMKKQADLYKRATVSKTGVLNMSKLHTYKYNDDLFAKMTTIPGATNHGMVMYVDWSGSMADNMAFTLKQLYNLVWFCNRTKIPFVVYGFSDHWHRRSGGDHDAPTIQNIKLNDMCLEEVKLLELFNSNMTKSEQEEQIKYLLRMTHSWCDRYNRHDPQEYIDVEYVMDKYNLGGTPLNHALLCAADVVEDFQMKTKVQKTNVIFLTDGDSHCADYVYDYPPSDSYHTNKGVQALSIGYDIDIVYNDKKRQIKVTTESNRYWRGEQTITLLKLLKKQTGAQVVGFFIEGRGRHGRVDVNTICRKMGWSRGSDEQKILDAQKKLKKEKVLVCKSQGYDEFYILPRGPRDSAQDEELNIKVGAKSNQIAKAFAKASGAKTVNRQLLNKFIGMVA